MIEVLLFLSVGLTAVSLVVLAVLLRRDPSSKLVAVENRFVTLEKGLDRAERAIHDEVATNRNEFSSSMKSLHRFDSVAPVRDWGFTKQPA